MYIWMYVYQTTHLSHTTDVTQKHLTLHLYSIAWAFVLMPSLHYRFVLISRQTSALIFTNRLLHFMRTCVTACWFSHIVRLLMVLLIIKERYSYDWPLHSTIMQGQYDSSLHTPPVPATSFLFLSYTLSHNTDKESTVCSKGYSVTFEFVDFGTPLSQTVTHIEILTATGLHKLIVAFSSKSLTVEAKTCFHTL